MIYKCIKPMELIEYDENGEETGHFGVVEDGSLWRLDESGSTIISGEIHLDCIIKGQKFSWIEMPKEVLKEHFKIIGK